MAQILVAHTGPAARRAQAGTGGGHGRSGGGRGGSGYTPRDDDDVEPSEK